MAEIPPEPVIPPDHAVDHDEQLPSDQTVAAFVSAAVRPGVVAGLHQPSSPPSWLPALPLLQCLYHRLQAPLRPTG